MCLDPLTPIADKILLFQKSKMAAAVILKIRKITMSPQQDDRFWRHLARWWVWAFQTLSANEISQCENPRWWRLPFKKNWKILISLQLIDQFCQNLTWWVLILWTPLAKKFGNFKNKRWPWQPFGKSKNRNISALDRPVLQKMACWCISFLPTALAYKILCF